MKTLYFDCFSGISGDMVIGALIDAGGDPVHLETELKKLTMENEYELKVYTVIKNGISSTKFDVLLSNEVHDQEHHSTITTITMNKVIIMSIVTTITMNKQNNHSHDHSHDHRSYKEIVKLIKSAEFSERVEGDAMSDI